VNLPDRLVELILAAAQVQREQAEGRVTFPAAEELLGVGDERGIGQSARLY
jgi:hypothetical protein